MTKAYRDNRIHWGRLLRNWAHQSLSYMDRGEQTLRILLEILEICIVAYVISSSGGGMPSALFSAILVVHSWNWMTNTNFWAAIQFSIPGRKNRGKPQTDDYLSRLSARASATSSISAVLLIGSSARGEWHEYSDIDIRFIRKKGLPNLLRAWLQITTERFRAFIRIQPLDMYLLDEWPENGSGRFSETPVILFDRTSGRGSQNP